MVAGGTWLWRDGARLTPAILRDLEALNDEFRRVWGVEILASSGIRTDDEQERIFRERYVPASQVNGRRVYDFRWWNGVQWARISAAGTVAVPGSSNHQLGGGRKGAVDVRDTGADAGVLTAGSPRARWLVDNAPRFGFSTDEGYSVREPWHLRYLRDPWADVAAPASLPAQPVDASTFDIPQEDSMRIISWSGHVFTVGQEYVKHETHLPHIKSLAHLYQPGTLYYELDNGGMDAVQLSLGIPWRAFELVLQGEAFNNNGDHASGDGRIWSRQMEVLDAVHGIQSITGNISRTLDDVRVLAEATPSPIVA